MTHLLKLKYLDRYFSFTSVPFRPTKVQMPNLALIETQQITVYTVQCTYCAMSNLANLCHFSVLACSLASTRTYVTLHVHRRKIKLIEGIAKCRHLKKLTCQGTLRQVFICIWARTPYTPPYTLYMCTVHKEGGRGER